MRILKEPLLHFLILGGLVYTASFWRQSDSARYRIDAGPERRAHLEATYRQQYGVTPTADQLDQLMDQYVRNEILYREGLALGLERDDEIVRRRVVQKVEFVNEDVDIQADPSDTELTKYFQAHADRYHTAPLVSFQQIFLSADPGGASVARARAERILRQLKQGHAVDAAAFGDAFPDGVEFTDLSKSRANSLFGNSQLSEALFTQAIGEWAGPYRSAYGWHLVRIGDRPGERPATLQSVRARVIADYSADLREQHNLSAFRRIANKYRVVTSGPHA